MTARASVDLPQPDSPTRPNISPRRDGKVEPVHGPDGQAPAGTEVQTQILQFQQGAVVITWGWPCVWPLWMPRLSLLGGQTVMQALVALPKGIAAVGHLQRMGAVGPAQAGTAPARRDVAGGAPLWGPAGAAARWRPCARG